MSWGGGAYRQAAQGVPEASLHLSLSPAMRLAPRSSSIPPLLQLASRCTPLLPHACPTTPHRWPARHRLRRCGGSERRASELGTLHRPPSQSAPIPAPLPRRSSSLLCSSSRARAVRVPVTASARCEPLLASLPSSAAGSEAEHAGGWRHTCATACHARGSHLTLTVCYRAVYKWVPSAGRVITGEEKRRFRHRLSPNCDFLVLHSPSTLSTSKTIRRVGPTWGIKRVRFGWEKTLIVKMMVYGMVLDG
jgi:hypothetical protein